MEAIGPLSSLVATLGGWAAWPFYVVLMFALSGFGAAKWVPVLRGLAEERRLGRQAKVAAIADAHNLIATLEQRGLNAADLRLTKEQLFRAVGLTPGPAKRAAEAEHAVDAKLDGALWSTDANVRTAVLALITASAAEVVLIPLRRLLGWQLSFFSGGYVADWPNAEGGGSGGFVLYGSFFIPAVVVFAILRLFVPPHLRRVQWAVGLAVSLAILTPF